MFFFSFSKCPEWLKGGDFTFVNVLFQTTAAPEHVVSSISYHGDSL